MSSRSKSGAELYIHIPFCVQKCSYCDFLSAPASDEVRADYLCALIKEMQKEKEALKCAKICSVFIGGGTPSILSADQIYRLLMAVRDHFTLASGCEFTMECNPESISMHKLAVMKEGGVNRISFGLQAVQNRLLAALGRAHDYERFVSAYRMARVSGFTNINIDIMYGLPGQSIGDWEETLLKVLLLSPEHISAYSLIIEEGTLFHTLYHTDTAFTKTGRTPKPLPSEETLLSMQELLCGMLDQHGFLRYEISNYAKPGYACRHNLGYWSDVPYLGVGLGASSYLKTPFSIRRTNTEDLLSYIKDPCGGRNEHLQSEKEHMEEYLFLGLRKTDGISTEDFYERFGVSITDRFGEVVRRHEEEGLLAFDSQRMFLTKKGLDLSNYVLCDFL